MFDELQKNVVRWAEDRNLFENSKPEKQLEKTQEELIETRDAVIALRELKAIKGRLKSIGCCREVLDYNQEEIRKAKDELKDGLGDIFVTLIIFAEMVGLDCGEALEAAYDVIKHRKGKMIGGKFVKEEDLDDLM